MSGDFYKPVNSQPENNEGTVQTIQKLSIFTGLLDVITAPSSFFKKIEGQGHTFWFPFLLITIFGVVFYAMYTNSVDMYQLLDTTLQVSGSSIDEVPPEALGITLTITKYTLMLSPIFLGIGYLVFAVYLMIVANIVSVKKISFGTWYAFAMWTAVPMIFSFSAMLLMFIKTGSGDNFVMVNQLNPLSLNSLIFHLDAMNPKTEVLASLDVFYFWSVGLCAFGFKQLTQSSWVSASLIIILPIVAIKILLLFFAM